MPILKVSWMTTRKSKSKKQEPVKSTRESLYEKETQKYPCEYCKASFSRESTFIAHSCEQKNRILNRDERHVRIGHQAFMEFHKPMSWIKQKSLTYEKFAKSRHYVAFIKFGKYVASVNPPKINNFIEWLVKQNVPFKEWATDRWYYNWIHELTRRETPEEAVERNILLMEQWALDTGENWIDFFRKVPTPQATDWIQRGRISPWLLYSDVGSQLLDRMTDEQLKLIKDWINPFEWNDRIKQHLTSFQSINELLISAGV